MFGGTPTTLTESTQFATKRLIGGSIKMSSSEMAKYIALIHNSLKTVYGELSNLKISEKNNQKKIVDNISSFISSNKPYDYATYYKLKGNMYIL